jgi:hypothetical protein
MKGLRIFVESGYMLELVLGRVLRLSNNHTLYKLESAEVLILPNDHTPEHYNITL